MTPWHTGGGPGPGATRVRRCLGKTRPGHDGAATPGHDEAGAPGRGATPPAPLLLWLLGPAGLGAHRHAGGARPRALLQQAQMRGEGDGGREGAATGSPRGASAMPTPQPPATTASPLPARPRAARRCKQGAARREGQASRQQALGCGGVEAWAGGRAHLAQAAGGGDGGAVVRDIKRPLCRSLPIQCHRLACGEMGGLRVGGAGASRGGAGRAAARGGRRRCPRGGKLAGSWRGGQRGCHAPVMGCLKPKDTSNGSLGLSLNSSLRATSARPRGCAWPWCHRQVSSCPAGARGGGGGGGGSTATHRPGARRRPPTHT
jgi:hypothetical protein